MKRSIALLHTSSGAVTLLLILAILSIAGCSGGDVQDASARKYGLEKSELIALKRAGKSRAELEKAEMIRKIEQMRERGIVVETTTSRKMLKKPR